MPKKIRIGDIVEIPTSKGMAYAQYSHAAKGEGGVIIRVLVGLFKKRPDSFEEVVEKKHKFITPFPLGPAINRGIFNVVGNVEVPDEEKIFPLFRAAGATDEEGIVKVWWLWDGEKEWPIGILPSKYIRLPILWVPNDTALVEMIEEGWTPETDVRTKKSIEKYGTT